MAVMPRVTLAGVPLAAVVPLATTIFPPGRRTTGPAGAIPSHGDRGSRRSRQGRARP
jgi:hypothetical protein